MDEHASDLVEGLPARPLRTVGPVIDIGRPDEPAPETAPWELRATASDAARPAHADSTARTDSAARGDSSTRAEATRPEATRTESTRTEGVRVETPRPAVERQATRTAPEPRRPEPPTQRRPEQPAAEARPERPASHTTTGRPASARPETSGERAARSGPSETSPVEQPVGDPAAPDPAPAANRRTKKGKPVMPSWDEVLLGVRGQR